MDKRKNSSRGKPFVDKRRTFAKETKLAEQLRREAAESRPTFSESLHQRIVISVGQRRSGGPIAVGHVTAAKQGRRRLAAVLAAACALGAAVLIGRQTLERRTEQRAETRIPPVAVATLADLPPLDEWANNAWENLDKLTTSANLQSQSEHLEHDARLAADTLLRRLPIDADWLDAP